MRAVAHASPCHGLTAHAKRGRVRGCLALALAGLLLALPAAADEAPPPPAEPAPSCSVCTGSKVKSWRIRKGDPKRPAATKTLKENDKDTEEPDLAE